MATIPKYKAKAVFWDSFTKTVISKDEIGKYRVNGKLVLPVSITRFDSQHEFRTYLELCRMYGDSMVNRQHKVEIFSPGLCYPKGRTWKADFAVVRPDRPDEVEAIVEAKGAMLPEFAYTLAVLEQAKPDVFDSLFIVFSDRLPVENKIISSLLNSSYEYRLLTLKELQCHNHLPFPL